MRNLLVLCSFLAVKAQGPLMMPDLNDDDDEKTMANPSYTSLWLASIWWEAGYQQGKSDSKPATCNEIRVQMNAKNMLSEHQLPNCKANGQWTPIQCGETHCWCGFLDAGYRIQTIPFVGRNMTLTCPKLTLMGKDPCHMTPSPIVTCKNTRGPRLKWIYDKLQQQCIQTESCTGFQSESECTSTCVPEPMSLCTLPLNEGNCSKEIGAHMGNDDQGHLGSITQPRFYFDPTTSTCKPFDHGRCGGNSNNFETSLQCMGSCIKDTQVTVMAKIGNQVLKLTLPAWLVVQLNLSPTEARDVPPTLVPMIFEHSFRKLTSENANDGTVQIVQMDAPMESRSAIFENEIPTIDMSQSALQPKKERNARCFKPPDAGICKAWAPKWYWSEKIQGCKVFGWGGCWQNLDREMENNFSGKYECVLLCAPIKNVNDNAEVKKFLDAGDPIQDAELPEIELGPQFQGVQNQRQILDIERRNIEAARPRPMMSMPGVMPMG